MEGGHSDQSGLAKDLDKDLKNCFKLLNMAIKLWGEKEVGGAGKMAQPAIRFPSPGPTW